jgi:hypothetical protein
MSSEPPGSSEAQEDARASDSSGGDVDTESGDGRRARWRSSIVTAVGVLAVVGGVGLFLFLTSGQDSKTEPVAEARGLACPYLQRAADAYDRGDQAAYNQAIGQAAHVAKDTLQTSGEVFGEPERIALELDLGAGQDVQRLLELARIACSELSSA